jgi:hypothetical protein
MLKIPKTIKCRKCNKSMKNPASQHRGYVPAPLCLNCLCHALGNMGKLKSWTKTKIKIQSEIKLDISPSPTQTNNKNKNDIITLSLYE